MAAYKKPCIHCGELIEGECRLCPKCGRRSPFGFQCPACLKSVQKDSKLCPGCGLPLETVCPYCGKTAFAASEKCDSCGRSLLIRCGNKRCNELQYFGNAKCTACGKVIKTGKKQITKGIREV